MQLGCGEQDSFHDDIFGATDDHVMDLEDDLDIFAAQNRSDQLGYHVEPYHPNPADFREGLRNYPVRRNKRPHDEI